jgi:multimeric flavodoxin WrbA
MKITVLHGQMHHGSTWHITQLFINALQNETAQISEFYFPKDGPAPCIGCFQCFLKGENYCPHAEAVQPIAASIEASDLVILESPCYVYGMSGQLKSFLDHMAYRWMSHRPHPSMSGKIGLCISTAAGLGSGRTAKDMQQNLFYWGISKLFRYSVNVSAMNWETIDPKRKARIEKQVSTMVSRIQKSAGAVKPGLKTRFLFSIMRLNQKGNTWNLTDRNHWVANGWLPAGKTDR